jgi:hypothetical protein
MIIIANKRALYPTSSPPSSRTVRCPPRFDGVCPVKSSSLDTNADRQTGDGGSPSQALHLNLAASSITLVDELEEDSTTPSRY